MEKITSESPKTKQESLGNLFEYIDYRTYLKDYYEVMKKRTRYFSYRSFSKVAGIKSPNFLQQVIDGNRNLTRAVVEKFLIALKLNEKEAIYFKNLVFFNQAKTAMEKQEYYIILKSLAKTVNEKLIGSDVYDYFGKWYMCVIRELICQHDFNNDYERIAEFVFPKITPKQVEEAIHFLLEVNLIKKREDGTFFQVDAAISTGPEVTSLAIRNFNHKMIELAGFALDNVPVKHRHASGITMGVPSEGFGVLVSEINAFKDRITRIANSFNNPTMVYQINVQLFPLSKVEDKG